MDTEPILPMSKRAHASDYARLLMALPRAVAWLVGAVLGSIVAGLVQGWRDAA